MADAQVSDACDSNIVWVQIPSLAPRAIKKTGFKYPIFCYYIISAYLYYEKAF